MLVVVFILDLIASKYIQFKTKSEVEDFVLVYHFLFRVINLLTIFVSGGLSSLLKADDIFVATEEVVSTKFVMAVSLR